MPEPAVQLEDRSPRTRRGRRCRWPSPPRCCRSARGRPWGRSTRVRKACSSTEQVPARDVGQHGVEEVAAGRLLPGGERHLHAYGGGVATLDRSSHRADGREVARGAERDVERGLVVAQSGRPEVPLHPVVEEEGARHRDTVRCHHPPAARNDHLDLPVVGAGASGTVGGPQGRGAGECRSEIGTDQSARARAGQHRTPGPLHPGRLAGVVDVHAGKEGRELDGDAPADVGRGPAGPPAWPGRGRRRRPGPGGSLRDPSPHHDRRPPARARPVADGSVDNEIVEESESACGSDPPRPSRSPRISGDSRQPQALAAGGRGAGTPTDGMPSPTEDAAGGADVRRSQASPARVRRTDWIALSATRWCGAA